MLLNEDMDMTNQVLSLTSPLHSDAKRSKWDGSFMQLPDAHRFVPALQG
jgi:hypothetical protein